MKWLNTSKEGDRTENWLATTPFGNIRVCSNGHKAMITNHPSEDCDLIGTEFSSVGEAKQNAENHYRASLNQAHQELQ